MGDRAGARVLRRVTRAVFLDRDGVLVDDVGLLTERSGIAIRPEAPRTLRALAQAGFRLVVVSNQTVVARGLLSEDEVERLQADVAAALESAGAPALDGFYYCPHHPSATLERYRIECDCRKPRPGMILRAAAELGIDVSRSFLVGDRPSDVTAGALAGCRTVLVRTGRHEDPPIESSLEYAQTVPDHTCADLAEAARWILAEA